MVNNFFIIFAIILVGSYILITFEALVLNPLRLILLLLLLLLLYYILQLNTIMFLFSIRLLFVRLSIETN